MNKKRLFSEAGLIGLVIAVLLLTAIINITFKGVRVDLTEDRLFTVSEGTKNIISSLEKPVTLKFYYSNKATEDIQQLRNYAKRVRELLEEYELKASGNITLEIIDPEPFSEDEDQASQYGLRAIQASLGGDGIYFGLAVISETGRQGTIPFFQMEREEYLEYDISELIYKTGQTKGTKLGVISTIDVAGGYNQMTRQPTPALTAIKQLEQVFEIEHLGVSVKAISDEIGALLLVHPKELDDDTLYSIDQFVLNGGNAMVFVDPNAQFSGEQSPIPVATGKDSNLKKLFDKWGVELQDKKILGDARHALMVNGGQSQQPVRHLGLLGFEKTNFNSDDVVTSKIESINVASAGSLTTIEGVETTFTPLIQSSDQAMLLDSEKFNYLFDPNVLYKEFTPTGERYTIAARVQGKVQSAFPDGHEITVEKDKDAAADDKKDEPVKREHLSESKEPINVIVIADTDLLSDRMWVRVRNFFGQSIASPFADNGTFVNNAVDSLFGNADLISIRSRGRYARPFEKVNEIRLEAESSYRRKEEELQQRLQETEAKLGELQAKKEGEDVLTLNEEQQKQVEMFQQQKLKIRKDLREVRHQLNSDIEQLGAWLKVINIAFIPILLTLLVLLHKFYRRKLLAGV